MPPTLPPALAKAMQQRLIYAEAPQRRELLACDCDWPRRPVRIAVVRNTPFVNTLRRHHTAHHNQSIMMERNMNLTFPVMDWLFGTSDLDRGLIGHLLNGYDTRFVKTNMRKTSRTPRPSAAEQPTGFATPAE